MANVKQESIFQRLTPPQYLVIGFAVTILIGAILLSLPIASEGKPVPFLDALFTATSAVCVTGLVVTDTATTFSTFGEVVIMLLIQTGGLGFMTFATFFAYLLGKRIGVRERLLLQQAFNQSKVGGIVKLVLYILSFTFILEGIGFTLLSLRWIPQFGWEKGLYYALFHSVSAFNNAGFDLFGDYGKFSNLTHFVNDPLVSLVISSLLILGGIGFIVLVELYQYRWTHRISLHTKLVLVTTGVLLAGGMLAFLLFEWGNPKTLGPLPLGGKFLASYFQSATPRTAGFNTVNLSDLYPATAFLIILLMFVGASPGSTGGGIKTTTFAAILLAVWGMTRGREDVVTFERTIPHRQVYKALTVMVASLTLVVVVTMLLTITESSEVFPVLFETVSAFGTVGLTLGLTPSLSAAGKCLIIGTMFAGRLGPLTIAFALAKKLETPTIRYPEEKPLIG
ncbi:K+ transporter Trk [Marinithermofilum abyssi]|uniref:K+ transporter Trk n=1 Tax=Marinithermofilum abyssi TaxID=1571185 RepID=A0A8J2YDV4_9BACL|nr:TrkH family potassium uptake protein [Marinithermofilum abyssi]GGE20639.1 K+ transporter Trk [Marinithermofilum abyssi]